MPPTLTSPFGNTQLAGRRFTLIKNLDKQLARKVVNKNTNNTSSDDTTQRITAYSEYYSTRWEAKSAYSIHASDMIIQVLGAKDESEIFDIFNWFAVELSSCLAADEPDISMCRLLASTVGEFLNVLRDVPSADSVKFKDLLVHSLEHSMQRTLAPQDNLVGNVLHDLVASKLVDCSRGSAGDSLEIPEH